MQKLERATQCVSVKWWAQNARGPYWTAGLNKAAASSCIMTQSV
jgi:hypothetical protein